MQNLITPITQLEGDVFPINSRNMSEEDIKALFIYYKGFEEFQLKQMYDLGVRAGKDAIELGEENPTSDEMFKLMYENVRY